ncbi:MAG: hypothetical protein IPM45_14325 [Acidimicrobiales bacterium]|nr:hypothetical protein [Acidimicrobiales bacterium]
MSRGRGEVHRCRGERGAAQVVAGVLIGVALVASAFAPAFVTAVLQDLNDIRNGRWWGSGQVASATQPPIRSIPFVGPAPPSDQQQAACVQQIAQGFGLQWTGASQGWRAPGSYPEPVLTGDPSVDRPAVYDWTSAMNGLVALASERWQSCFTTTTEGATTTLVEPVIPGTYLLTFQGGGNDVCQLPAPMTVRVSRDGANVTVTGPLVPGGGEASVTAPLGADFSFNGSASLPSGIGIGLRGRFDLFDQTTLIRDGLLTHDVGGGCGYSFQGERTGD